LVGSESNKSNNNIDEILVTDNLVSEAINGYFPEEFHPSLCKPFEGCYVMMIVWLEDGIAERAGLGIVGKDAIFKSCRRPVEWKEILLG
jgi:hypothetical protein